MRSRPRKGISLRACRLPGFEQVIGGPPCVSVMIVRRARGVRSTKEGKQQRGSTDLGSRGPFKENQRQICWAIVIELKSS